MRSRADLRKKFIPGEPEVGCFRHLPSRKGGSARVAIDVLPQRHRAVLPDRTRRCPSVPAASCIVSRRHRGRWPKRVDHLRQNRRQDSAGKGIQACRVAGAQLPRRGQDASSRLLEGFGCLAWNGILPASRIVERAARNGRCRIKAALVSGRHANLPKPAGPRSQWTFSALLRQCVRPHATAHHSAVFTACCTPADKFGCGTTSSRGQRRFPTQQRSDGLASVKPAPLSTRRLARHRRTWCIVHSVRRSGAVGSPQW